METQKPLHEHEWRFDTIPNEQLIECCYYEYGRESAWLRQANLELVQAGGGTGFGLLHPASEPAPWQSLAESVKESLQPLSPRSGSPLRLARWQQTMTLHRACLARVQRLSKQIQVRPSASARTEEERQARREAALENPPNQPQRQGIIPLAGEAKEAQMLALEELASVVPRKQNRLGGELVMFEIQWKKFTNAEIARAFDQWVATNRPDALGEREHRGPSVKPWRARLDRLGIMRLLHRYTFKEMTAALPASYEKSAKYSNPSDCYAERKNAMTDFRKLFPFTPRNEEPLSWQMKQQDVV